jgi:hypothetical protein
MHNPARLAVEIEGNTIMVSLPEADEHVTYCKDPISPMLVATDSLRGHLTPSRIAFLVEAWKLAHDAAHEIGWIRS